MSQREKIREALTRILKQKGDGKEFKDEDDLVELGRMDSFGIVELIAFLETEYRIDFSSKNALPTDFNSVKSILAIIGDNN